MSLNKKIDFVLIENKSYPKLLKEIPSPPLKIYFLGQLPDEKSLKVAIVGTRKATKEGRILAKFISKSLAKTGATIISGLAMGIDTAAHEGALEADGKTIAVLANGLDEIYPAQNEKLAEKIIKSGGGIISEYPVKTPPYKNQFLERNRIVSGLSHATIIIEAPLISGSLATARLAAEQGREVFVFPGPSSHPNYVGSHRLIRDGARLVSSIEDVFEDLGLDTKYEKLRIYEKNKLKTIKDKNQLLILKMMQEAGRPLNIDKIIELTKLEPQKANTAIALLIINDIIKETEKGYAI